MKGYVFKILKFIRKMLLGAILLFLGLLLLLLVVRGVMKIKNQKTPEGGINESMYVDVNGSKQWISIYGQDRKNPVLLYLHGGPGSSTSYMDYVFTRKWSDVYTVVTWDQRNCGKSYRKEQDSTEITYDMMMEDGVAVTKYILDHMDVDKITLLGHSWGSIFGANLVLEYPEYYDCFIGTGQLVDMYENEKAFKEEAKKWVGTNYVDEEILNSMDPDHIDITYLNNKNYLMDKYGYGLFQAGTDYNMVTTILFNPYYSIVDLLKLGKQNQEVYIDFICSDEFSKFSLLNKTSYEVPFYNINGDKDYQVNHKLAEAYFDEVDAPQKELYIMQNMTHGLLESKTSKFSDYVHEIATKTTE